jgi:hypothetical protein
VDEEHDGAVAAVDERQGVPVQRHRLRANGAHIVTFDLT